MSKSRGMKILSLTMLGLLMLLMTGCVRTVAASTPLQQQEVLSSQGEVPVEATGVQQSKPPTAEGEYATYLGVHVGVSDGAQLLALRLSGDGTATFHSESYNDEPPIVEVGSWVQNDDGSLTVTLTGREDQTYDEPKLITFQIDGDMLRAVEYDAATYGSEGIRLRIAHEVARAADASLITIDLAAGFPLDPTFVSVNGGGEVDASLLGSHCRGYINREPIVTVDWRGVSDFVEAFFVSDHDPTLVILTPDGQVLCNDDANEQLLDPVIQMDNPVTGTYQIWVGSYVPNHLIPGVLVLTTKPDVNLGTFNLGTFVQRAALPEVLPEPESIGDEHPLAQIAAAGLENALALDAGETPVTVEITAEGTVPLFQLPLAERGCAGLVSGVPDYVFTWTGDTELLRIYFEGQSDATLLVLGPDRLEACGDDAAFGVNANPLVDVASPEEGVYAVYVGRFDPSVPVGGVLTITESAEAEPEVLSPLGK